MLTTADRAVLLQRQRSLEATIDLFEREIAHLVSLQRQAKRAIGQIRQELRDEAAQGISAEVWDRR